MDDRCRLTEKVIFEQKLEEGERASNMDIRGRSESHSGRAGAELRRQECVCHV